MKRVIKSEPQETIVDMYDVDENNFVFYLDGSDHGVWFLIKHNDYYGFRRVLSTDGMRYGTDNMVATMESAIASGEKVWTCTGKEMYKFMSEVIE